MLSIWYSITGNSLQHPGALNAPMWRRVIVMKDAMQCVPASFVSPSLFAPCHCSAPCHSSSREGAGTEEQVGVEMRKPVCCAGNVFVLTNVPSCKLEPCTYDMCKSALDPLKLESCAHQSFLAGARSRVLWMLTTVSSCSWIVSTTFQILIPLTTFQILLLPVLV